MSVSNVTSSIASAEALGKSAGHAAAADVLFCRYEFNVTCNLTGVGDHIIIVGSLGETKQGDPFSYLNF